MIDHQEEQRNSSPGTSMFPQPLTTKEIDNKKLEQLGLIRQAKTNDVLSNVFFLVAALSLVFTFIFAAAAIAQLFSKGKIESSLIETLILTCLVTIPSVLIKIKTQKKYLSIKNDPRSDPCAYQSILVDENKCRDVAEWIKKYDDINDYVLKVCNLNRFLNHMEYQLIKEIVSEKESAIHHLTKLFSLDQPQARK